MPLTERIPFAEAVSERLLLKKRFEEDISLEQRTVLKVFYGMELTAEEERLWQLFQGHVPMDELGYPLWDQQATAAAYVPKEYAQMWAIMGRRSGKALALDTPIPTPTGMTTMGAVRVGDEIYDEQGHPCKVTFVTEVQHDRPCYQVCFSDGHTLTADADHQWLVWGKEARKALREPRRHSVPEVRTTAELRLALRTGSGEANWAVPLALPVERQSPPLPIDPYLFGVWLGDGHTHNGRFTTADAEVVESWRQHYELRQHPDDPITYTVYGLRAQLRELGVLGRKHIPDVYIYASVEDRQRLIQGLFDSDGWAKPKGCAFDNTNSDIVEATRTILESLGCRVTVRSKIPKLNGKLCKRVYTLETQAAFPLFRLARKVKNQRLLDPNKPRFRYITGIVPIESVPVRCLQVDSPNRLFLAGTGHIITHNTDSIISTALAYEAVLGGHLSEVRQGQETIIYLISQNKEVGVLNLAFVRQALESSPILAKEIDRSLAEEICLKNGITIKSSPPSLKSQRGLAIPVVAFDEVGFWYKDADSANPDFEVERAIRWNQAQFTNSKRFGISSPWTKEGLLYKYAMAGTEGVKLQSDTERPKYKGILVMHASTAAMGNPLISREKLEAERLADEESFKRESLALFTDSVSGFLSTELLKFAVDPGISERPPYPRPPEEQDRQKPDPHFVYVGAMDPAFRSDSFGFAITHYDPEKGVVVDVARRWNPTPGTKLNPEVILQEIVAICQRYRISMVYSDQYQLESLQQLALKYGIVIDGIDFTARSKGQIFGNFQQLVNQRRLRLLDPLGHPAAQEMYTELGQLERIARPNGTVSISAPAGKHDDMACCVALAAYKCIWMRATLVQPQADAKKEPTHVERGMAVIRQRTGRSDHRGAWANWD